MTKIVTPKTTTITDLIRICQVETDLIRRRLAIHRPGDTVYDVQEACRAAATLHQASGQLLHTLDPDGDFTGRTTHWNGQLAPFYAEPKFPRIPRCPIHDAIIEDNDCEYCRAEADQS